MPRKEKEAKRLSKLDRSPSPSRVQLVSPVIRCRPKLPFRCLEEMPKAYCCDASKFRGHRCDFSFVEAALSTLDPRHNEFWNCLTDELPIIFFAFAAIDMHADPAYAYAPAAVRAAFVFTSIGTCFQHACSLFAHTFNCCNPRLSRTIWIVDYAGIAVNFVHNAPMIFIVARGLPSSPGAFNEWRWIWVWIGTNIIITVSLFLWATWFAATQTMPESVSWVAMAFKSGYRSALGLGVLILPMFLFTFIAGLRTDTRGFNILSVLVASVVVFKEGHVPEALFIGTKIFDFSPIHSHVLWHLGVWLGQAYYLAMYSRYFGLLAATSDGTDSYVALHNCIAQVPTRATHFELGPRGFGAAVDAFLVY